MKTGNGKIANLPAEIRDQLNDRIAEGEEGIELVEWLNSKPEVTEVVSKLFDGTPISEQCTARKRYFYNVAERSPATQPPSRPMPAYRDPRSRYSLA